MLSKMLTGRCSSGSLAIRDLLDSGYPVLKPRKSQPIHADIAEGFNQGA
jgi:hypothetical protein